MSGESLLPAKLPERRQRRSRRLAIALYLLALLALLVMFAAILAVQHRHDLEAARGRAGARADLVAKWVETTFSVSDYALDSLSHLFDMSQDGQMTGRPFAAGELEALLASRRDRLAFIDELSLVDAAGRVIASSATYWRPGHDLSSRTFYRAFLEDPSLDSLVTPLQWSPFGQTYHFVYARRLRGPDGKSRGLAMLRLDPAIFGESIARLGMTRGESIAILDTAMRLITRRPAFGEGDAMTVLGTPVSEPLTRAFLDSDAPATALRSVSPLDGRERLYAMHRVAGLPLLVVVGEELEVLLAGWWQRLWLLGGVFLVVAALGWWLLCHYLGRLRLLAELRIAATAFETHVGMLITDAQARILKVNDTFTRITGYPEAEVLGRNPRLLSAGRHDTTFYRYLWECVQQNGSWQGEIWNRRRNGEVFPEWLTISAVHNAAGEVTHYVATFNDITQRKADEAEIHQLAFYDPLTGLPNRRLMLDRLARALKDGVRSGQFGALLYLDLDNFKQVNDTLGHHVGDLLLQQVANRLGGVLRETDTLARLGGDEFGVLLHDLGRDPQRVAVITEGIANKLFGALQAPVSLAGRSVMITGSIGVTLYRDHDTTLEEILQQADMALFQAKQSGRDTLRFFDPGMQAQLQARSRLEADLRQALSREEFLLHYQPQVDAERRLIGVEALLRWQYPAHGLVSPGEFIPLAEETRLIVPIGDWVLETACRQLVAWAAEPAMAHLTISVNVSARQFREPDFAERVQASLTRTGAPPERLKLEVTESLFVDDRDEARETMQRLRKHGVTFALDDFGTGYSSLSYLKRLPLDQLKIDQAFVRDLLEDEASAAIVASTIALSESLQLAVIAEGVETEAQRDWLVAHGCRAFQGYLFGRPVPVEQLAMPGPERLTIRMP